MGPNRTTWKNGPLTALISSATMKYEQVLYNIFTKRRFSNDVLTDKTIRQRTIGAALERLGNPHKKFNCVHVTGTNGKGSTSTKIATLLQDTAVGDVGLFTSPHIFSFRERIRVNNQLISQEEVVRLHDEVMSVYDGDHEPLFFEVCLLIGILHFARCNVEWAVFEAGMGGLLDSTNVLTPSAAVVTSVGWDHVGVLGNTLEEIAEEKAGIIKPFTPAIIGPQANVFPIFERTAHLKKALFTPVVVPDSLGRVVSALESDIGVTTPRQRPAADVTMVNACVAAAAVDCLPALPPCSDDALLKAVLARPPLRFQVLPAVAKARALEVAAVRLNQQPDADVNERTGSFDVILDVGHNQTALERFAVQLVDFARSHKRSGIRLLCGVSIERTVAILRPLVEGISTLAPELSLSMHYVDCDHPRIKKMDKVLQECDSSDNAVDKRIGRLIRESNSYTGDSLRTAAAAVEAASASNDCLVASGSFFIMPEVLAGMGLLPSWAEKGSGELWFKETDSAADPASLSARLNDASLSGLPPALDDSDVLGFRKGWFVEEESQRVAALSDGAVNKIKESMAATKRGIKKEGW